MKIKRKILSLLLIIALFISVVGVFNVDTTYAATKKIHLKKTSVSLTAGKTYQQKLIDKKGKTIKATKVKWKSSKPSIATITKKGKVKALKKGTVKITAKYKGKTYKFKVVVKEPFPTSAKPTLKLVEYSDSILLKWTKVKNAISYQIYISVNNGKYTYLDTVDEGFVDYTYWDAKPGKTYSFKVRAKAGAYKSSFSAVKSLKFLSNSSVSVDQDDITVVMGKSKKVRISTDKRCSIEYDTNNSNISCKWGDWISGTNDVNLTITGEEAGTSVVTVYDSSDKKVKATINVTIKHEVDISIPELPASYKYGSYSTAKINKLEFEYSGPFNGTYYVKGVFYGEKTYDYRPNTSSCCRIGYKLYDSEGYVVESGTFYSDSVVPGEKFKGTTYISTHLAPGTYRLELLNVSA